METVLGARFEDFKVHSPGYTSRVFNTERFLDLVEKTVAQVERIRVLHPEIEALACCGNSGVILTGAVAARLRMPFLVVRKTMDTNHDDKWVNGYLGAKAYLFVDDLISSGRTMRHVAERISMVCEAKLVGALLYENGDTNYEMWLGGWTGALPGYCWSVDAPDASVPASADAALSRAIRDPRPEAPKLKLVTSPAPEVTPTLVVRYGSGWKTKTSGSTYTTYRQLGDQLVAINGARDSP